MHIFFSTTNFPPKNVECIVGGAMRHLACREHHKATTNIIKGQQLNRRTCSYLDFLILQSFLGS